MVQPINKMKLKNIFLTWYAFRWNSNTKKTVFTNVLYGMEEEIYKKVKKGEKDKWKPVTDYASFKEFIKLKLMCRFWCKAEHETCIGGLFYHTEEYLEKHDIWWQLEPNLDRICEYIIKEMDIKFKK